MYLEIAAVVAELVTRVAVRLDEGTIAIERGGIGAGLYLQR